MYTREPYVPVKLLEAQLEALYDRLQPPEKLLRLVKLEIEVIARRREAIAKKELTRLRRALGTTEAKEMKLVELRIEDVEKIHPSSDLAWTEHVKKR